MKKAINWETSKKITLRKYDKRKNEEDEEIDLPL